MTLDMPRFSHYIDEIVVLAQKDFKIRYRNSVLGFLWSLLNPLAYMLILTLVFKFLLRTTIPNFAAWILTGVLVWRFFALGTSGGLNSILGNAPLVSKVYLPRQILVLSNNLANFLGSSLEFLTLFPLLIFLGINMTVYILLLPIILFVEFLLIFGLSLGLSSLFLKYRDFYQIWDIALQLGFWLSPIVYDASLIPPRYSFVYSLNPVTRLIEFTRGIFLENTMPTAKDVFVLLAAVAIIGITGYLIFRRFEKRFAEEL